jgi:hypothetical protein
VIEGLDGTINLGSDHKSGKGFHKKSSKSLQQKEKGKNFRPSPLAVA